MISLYLMNSGNEKITDKELFSLVGEVSDEVRSEIMSIATKIEARGEARGMTLNNIRVIEKMLEKETPWSFITDVTGFTEREYKATKAKL